MIGFGSNRLTIARRGGMSVTQAGRGGMEWLAGGRYPDWATPYSAQATAALKAQFPTQWPTIRDYGFAHPALVPFINEDPMLVMSLIEGLGVRWLIGNGSSYFKTTFKPTATDMIKAKVMPTNIGANQVPYGARNVAGQATTGSYQDWFLGNKLRMDWAVSNTTTIEAPNLTLTNNTVYVIEEKKGYCKVNGVVKYNQSVQSETLLYPFYVFANNNAGSVGAITAMKFAYIYKNDEPLLVPFKRNNTAELLDLSTGQLAERVGSFTISETPAS